MTPSPAEISGNIQGKVWLLGDNINTDLIHPSTYFSLEQDTLKQGISKGMGLLHKKAAPEEPIHDLVIVAGKNFGCGSSRESSVRALYATGVKAIIARSFARIFYRSLVNRGIAPIICPDCHDRATDGDPIEIRMDRQCVVINKTEEIPFQPFDPHIQKILEKGGLIAYLEDERPSGTPGV